MSSKSFSIVFVVLLAISVIVLGVGKLNQNASNLLSSPAPGATTLQPNVSIEPVKGESLKTSPPTNQKNKQYLQFPGVFAPEVLKNKAAIINTKKGRMVISLYPEASKAASNFISLVNDKFYDGLTFHRVEPGFVIQGGDPLGNGTGGPGYTFEDESISGVYNRGVLAMANAGPNTNGSQFFIMLADHPELPKKYTIFGKVLQGLDVLDKIQKGDVIDSIQIINTNSTF